MSLADLVDHFLASVRLSVELSDLMHTNHLLDKLVGEQAAGRGVV